jgi:hypothetical protein
MTTTETLCAMIRERASVGLKKYGVTVDRKDLAADQWLQHSIEERIDDLQYMMRLREEINTIKSELEKAEEKLQRKQDAGDLLFEELDDKTPEPNCSCFVISPCSDCTKHGRNRQALEAWKEADK